MSVRNTDPAREPFGEDQRNSRDSGQIAIRPSRGIVLPTAHNNNVRVPCATMGRMRRMVDAADWRISDALGDRQRRLINVPKPEYLVERATAEAEQAAICGLIQLTWEESTERRGYFRLVAQVPLSDVTFDQLFNGRSGYRAQYYLSPEEGILYNRDIIAAMTPVVKIAYEKHPIQVAFDFVEQSAQAPHSKVWAFGEKAAFDDATHDTVNPPRWVANGATRGRKAPLPAHLMIDIKGTFIRPGTSDLFVDDLKLDRAWDLFNRGFT